MLDDLDRQIDVFERGASDEEGLVRIVDVVGRVFRERLLPPHRGTCDANVIIYRVY